MKYVIAVAVCAAASMLSCAAGAKTVTVTTPAQLDAALRSAKGGDTIKVAPGNYGDFDIRAINPASAVNIVSANSSRPPVFTRLTIRDSSQLRLTRLIVNSPQPDDLNPASTTTEIYRSSDIRLASMVFSGVAGGNISNEPRGLRLSQSSSITVAGSTFTDLSHGIVTDGSSRMTITDNSFSRIRTDGIIADGASTSLIARNRFSTFRPDELDHPDAIQIFNNFTPTYNLTVADNLIIGDVAGQMQGIFMTNSVGIRAQLDRVMITGNVMWGTMWNGIAAFDANRVTVSDNLLFSNTALESSKTWVRLEDVTAATVSSNRAGAYIYSELGGLTGSGNVMSLSSSGALAAITLWDLTHTASNLQTRNFLNGAVGYDDEDDGLDFAASRSVAAVPEPASWLTMIVGFFGLGIARRRLQRRRARLICAA